MWTIVRENVAASLQILENWQTDHQFAAQVIVFIWCFIETKTRLLWSKKGGPRYVSLQCLTYQMYDSGELR